jgi:outer membrane protein insertion porin family
MEYRRQVTATYFNLTLALIALLVIFLHGCIVPKDFPKNKAFVYKTEIKVTGDTSKVIKEDLELKLYNQLDDSLRVRTVTSPISFKPFGIFYRKLSSPPAFDSTNVSRSVGFMTDLLNSLGYYAPTIKDSVRIDTVKKNKPEKKQIRATIRFAVNTGRNLKFDSIGFALNVPALQTLALKSKGESLLKINNPYSKQIVSAEIDRLVDLFRNEGYYRISRDDLYAERDTVEAALIDPTLDPFQQAKLLEELKEKREHPTINVVIKLRQIEDSDRIKRYSIGKITIYPDLPLLEDSTLTVKNDTFRFENGITIIARSDKFNNKFLINNVFLQQGKQYRLDAYNRTLIRFNSELGAWQQATIDLNESDSYDTVLDATLRLYPTLKQTLRPSLEGSYNTNDILTGTNLYAIDLSLTWLNKNAYARSVQTTTSLSGGVEFGTNFIQTTQTSFSHTIYLPRLNAPGPFAVKNKSWQLTNTHTVINLSAAYTDRRGLFTLGSINGSYGFEWMITNKRKNLSHAFAWRPLNIEYANFSYTDSFRTNYLDMYPSLANAFKNGLVVGVGFGQVVYTRVKQHGIHTNHLRISGEESGTLVGLVQAFDKGQLKRFVKGDVDFWHHFDFRTTQLALHVYAGAGKEYGEGKGDTQILPFYKAYWAGGPNSMRGWIVRQIGLGSDINAFGGYDRFGDVQFESNAEFRFPLGTLFSVKLKSAVFADMGNIWDWTSTLGKGADFELNRFYKELGLDVGTGLRIDFDYFLIRFDWAVKARDPQSVLYPNRWFYDFNLSKGQFQLGIGYPF